MTLLPHNFRLIAGILNFKRFAESTEIVILNMGRRRRYLKQSGAIFPSVDPPSGVTVALRLKAIMLSGSKLSDRFTTFWATRQTKQVCVRRHQAAFRRLDFIRRQLDSLFLPQLMQLLIKLDRPARFQRSQQFERPILHFRIWHRDVISDGFADLNGLFITVNQASQVPALQRHGQILYRKQFKRGCGNRLNSMLKCRAVEFIWPKLP